MHVFADGTCFDSNSPLLDGVSVINRGEKMDGQFFTLLYDTSVKNTYL